MLTKACEYGIKAAVFLAQRSKEGFLSNVKEIAQAIDSPEAFTAKVLQLLVRSNLISSVRGVNGGFFIEKRTLKSLNLLQIVAAIDGEGLITNCFLGLTLCSDVNPCPMHDQYKHIKADIIDMLCNTRVDSLTDGVLRKLSVLKN